MTTGTGEAKLSFFVTSVKLEELLVTWLTGFREKFMSGTQHWLDKAYNMSNWENFRRYTPASLVFALQRRLGLTVEPTTIATRREVISPAEHHSARPAAYYLPNQLDKVMATQENSTFSQEYNRIAGKPINHAATVAYRLDNVNFIHGVLYSGRSCWAQVHQKARPGFYKIDRELEEVALPTSLVGDKFFGHFVCDDSATTLLATNWGDVYYASSGARGDWHHASDYLEVYGLEFPTLQTAHIRQAWVFEDYGMNANRRKRLEALRTRIRAQGSRRSGHNIYIRRRGGGAPRTLTNEIQLEERLRREGFEIVDPVNMSTREVITRTSNAALVCSVEGSAVAHGYLAAAPNAAILTIQPPYRFTNIWKDFCDASDFRYGFVVGEGKPGEFTVSVDDLLRTADLLVKANPKQRVFA